MGSDISICVQRRTADGWEFVPLWQTFDAWHNHPLTRRNYDVFGILAGVRNFDIPHIATPRGLPDGFFVPESPCSRTPTKWRECREQDHMHWEDDPYFIESECHSVSWLTLAELDAFDWEAAFNHPEATDWSHPERPVFVTKGIPWLHTLGAPDDIRIIFGFDC